MTVSRLARPVAALLVVLLALPVALPAAAAAPAVDPACAPGAVEAVKRVFLDPWMPDLRVVSGVLCVRDDGTIASSAVVADGCTSTSHLLNGRSWQTPYTFRVDPRNSGLDSGATLAAFEAGGLVWEQETAKDIVGAVTTGGDGGRAGTRDQVNQVGFKNLGSTGVLARTTTWFTSTGRALEADIVFNTAYGWSTTGAKGKADLQSVAAHEIGHALGLDHAATGSANACLTMYPSTPLGATYGRTLGAGDILGIQKIYGAAAPAPEPAPTPSPTPEPFAASFAPKKGNNWWVETDVTGNAPIARVTATVEGSAPRELTLRSWGSWAASFYVTTGSHVRFTAYASDGRSVESGVYSWPDASPVTTPKFEATFVKHAGNSWWIEARVDANLPLAGVTASVNGGAPVALTYRSWGTWAVSVYVPAGSSVTFTATSTDGQKATSGAFPWP